MNKIFSAICIFVQILSVNISAHQLLGGGNPHDSLLFEAAGYYSANNSATRCPIVLKYISGIG